MSVGTVEEAAPRVAGAQPRSFVLTLAGLVGQLALAVLVVRQFQLESNAFFRVLLVVAAGFVPHALLPRKHRLRFFVVLSLVGIIAALGVSDGLWLIGIGLVLVIEGLLWALAPRLAFRLLRAAVETPEERLRLGGAAAVAIGVVLVWLARG